MQATVIVNRRSSRSDRYAARLPALLAARNIEAGPIVFVDSEATLRRALRRAVKRGTTFAIVGGGDGSQTTAVDVLAHRDVVLGVLPLGTGNSFAMTLGIPDDPERALDALAAYRIARVDLGVVNGTHFANFATIGLPAEIAASAPHALKRIVGTASYLVGGIRAFFVKRSFRARVRYDGGKLAWRTKQMVVANGRYFGHVPLASDATITDRRLAFFSTSGVSHVEIARSYVALGLGLQDKLPDKLAFASHEIVVKCKPKQAVSIDGNAFGKTPARFTVAPKALRACVGPDFAIAE